MYVCDIDDNAVGHHISLDPDTLPPRQPETELAFRTYTLFFFLAFPSFSH